MTPAILNNGPARALLAGLNRQRGLTEVAAWSLAAAVVARASNLAAMAICARLLGQADFGVVAAILSTVGMFAPLASMGLGMTTTKFVSEYRDHEPDRAGRILALSMWAATLAGAAMSGALIVLAPQLAAAAFGAPEMAPHLAASCGLLALGVVETVQNGALAGLEAFSRIAKLSAWSAVAALPVTAVLAYRFGTSGAVAALTVSLAISCLLNAIALRAECRKRNIRVSLSGWRSECGVLWSFSLPAYFSGILVAPVTWLGGALLVQHAGFAEMAEFSAADRFRYILIFVPLAVSRIVVPTLSRLRAAGDHSGYRVALRWNLGFGALATVPAALACALFARPLMALFGASFGDAWPVLALLAASAIPTVINTQLGAAVLSNGRAWWRTSADALLAVVFVAVACFAVPRWHALGLAASMAIAYSAACLALGWFLRHTHRSEEEDACVA